MSRSYQEGFSAKHHASMHDRVGRERKAATMVRILADALGADRLSSLTLLDVGASTGLIDHYLAQHFRHVTGIDIDTLAVQHAQQAFSCDNLVFGQGDAMALRFPDASVDIVICSQVYEHVPDAGRMLEEIFRVLRPGGVCYFAAGNRFAVDEHHYNLPFLSAIPRPLAHLYVRLAGKADYYYEKHFSVWTLRRLVRRFELVDYTLRVIDDPDRFGASYMLRPGSRKQRIARLVARWAYWLVPGYLWVLRKPGG